MGRRDAGKPAAGSLPGFRVGRGYWGGPRGEVPLVDGASAGAAPFGGADCSLFPVDSLRIR